MITLDINNINNKYHTKSIYKPSKSLSNYQYEKNDCFVSPTLKNYIAYTNISFGKRLFIEDLVKKTHGKNCQGAGLFVKKDDGSTSDYVDWDKVGWKYLKAEPIDWKTATKDDIQVFWHSLALAEAKDTTWVKRFNPQNVEYPLAVFRHIVSNDAKREFSKNIEEMNEIQKKSVKVKNLLDTPIVNENGTLNFAFTVFDTETTGINLPVENSEFESLIKSPKDLYNEKIVEEPSEIIQIGALKFDNQGKLIPESAISQLLKPDRPIPQGAIDVHGITNEQVADKPKINSILKKFETNYLGKDIIVAYNSKFDIKLLNHSINKYNEFDSKKLDSRKQSLVIDPMTLIMRIHPYLGAKKKLGEQYKYLFGQDLEGAHDAFADVRATADVLKYCLYYLGKKSKEQGKTLRIRDVLLFQNEYCTDRMGVKLDICGVNAEKSFAESYGNEAEIVNIDNYMDGYKLTAEKLEDLKNQIGDKNYQLLKKEDFIGKKITNFKDGYGQMPKETLNDLKHKYHKNVNMRYLMKENFKKVLLNVGIQPYKDLSRDDIINTIVRNSKNHTKGMFDIWMKNADLQDVSKGNDLPDIEVARKVMLEHLDEDEKYPNLETHSLK